MLALLTYRTHCAGPLIWQGRRSTVRIAILSTPHVPTPPNGYGASELIAGLLADGLTRRGHYVRLFAREGSAAFASETISFREVERAETFDQRELVHVARAMERVADCDLVHNHCLAVGPALLALGGRPTLTTLHYVHPIARAFADQSYIAVSDHQRRSLPGINIVARVYNGIDLDAFPPGDCRGDYLLFLGRFHPNKGADLAIEVAQRAGRPLVIAAPAPPPDQQDWFDLAIRPRLGGRIEWIGAVDDRVKVPLLQRARATLLPIRWDEPFGLVMIESMACGTPPIVFHRGAAPEIVVNGVTGFVVNSLDEMVRAVERVDQLDPQACREHVARNFSARRMVDSYLALYEHYLVRSRARRTKTKLGTGTPSS